MLRAGPLEPVLRGLLTKDPALRTAAPLARQQLGAVANGLMPPLPAPLPMPIPAPMQAPAPVRAPPADAVAPPPRDAVRHGTAMTRFDADDLRRLASASAAVLGTVARESATRIAERTRRPPSSSPTGAPRRRRFKRRWVVVPVLVIVVVAILVVGGLLLLAAHLMGFV
jgi:hypothetical protein